MKNKSTAFRWSRFSALLRVDLAERWRSYAGLLVIALIVQMLLLAWILFVNRSPKPMHLDAQQGWYYSFLFIFGVAFCFLFYAPMQRQGSSLLALMRPASTLEKWLHAACMLVVLFPLAYTVCYLIATVPINALAALAESTRYRAEIAAATRPAPSEPIGFHVYLPLLSNADAHGDKPWKQLVYYWWYLILCGYAAFALVLFRRAAAFKAVALVFIVLILSVMAMSKGGNASVLIHWLDGRQRPSMSASAVLANLLLWLGVPLLVWCSAWLALRERDLT